MREWTPTEGRPCEDTGRRHCLQSPGAGPREQPCDTFTLGFRPLELGENKFLLSKLPRLCYFVMTAQADSYFISDVVLSSWQWPALNK